MPSLLFSQLNHSLLLLAAAGLIFTTTFTRTTSAYQQPKPLSGSTTESTWSIVQKKRRWSSSTTAAIAHQNRRRRKTTRTTTSSQQRNDKQKLKFQNDDSTVPLSEGALPWAKLTEVAFMGDIVDGEIVAMNRGGAIVRICGREGSSSSSTSSNSNSNKDDDDEFKGTRAFLPHSHLRNNRRCYDENNVLQIGEILPVKIIDLDMGKHKLVVSHREAIKESLSVGDVVTGTVAGIRPYGAFVKFHGGTMKGLIHKSNISYNDWKLRSSNEGFEIEKCFRDVECGETDDVLLRIGSKVKCLVREYDKYTGRISLSTEALEPEPGDFLCDPQSVFDKAEETAIMYNDNIQLQKFLSNKLLAEHTLSAALNKNEEVGNDNDRQQRLDNAKKYLP